MIQARTTQQQTPDMICIHSFTPYQRRVLRPWHAGVLWGKDPRLALPLMAALRETGDIVVGDNEPYSGHHPADYTVDHHAETQASTALRATSSKREPGEQSSSTHSVTMSDSFVPRASICPSGG